MNLDGVACRVLVLELLPEGFDRLVERFGCGLETFRSANSTQGRLPTVRVSPIGYSL